MFGTKNTAEIAYFYLTHDSEYEVVAFTVDENYLKEKQFHNLPVVPFETVEEYYPPEKFSMFIAVGYQNTNKLRAERYNMAKNKGYDLISYVNSKSITWGDTEIGDNCFILENQVIQPFVRIGNNVTIWSGNHIGHHSVIEDHCFISSHVVISGHVRIKPYSFLGVNSTIRDGITVERECVVGAGAIILRNTKEKGVYIGAGAKLYSSDSSRIDI